MMRAVIDLHCHLLPGIDDGPATTAEAVALARAFVAAGVTRVAATPHVEPKWGNTADTIHAAWLGFVTELARARVPFEVVAGAELDLLQSRVSMPASWTGCALGIDGPLLIECPFSPIVPQFESLVGALQAAAPRPARPSGALAGVSAGPRAAAAPGRQPGRDGVGDRRVVCGSLRPHRTAVRVLDGRRGPRPRRGQRRARHRRSPARPRRPAARRRLRLGRGVADDDGARGDPRGRELPRRPVAPPAAPGGWARVRRALAR